MEPDKADGVSGATPYPSAWMRGFLPALVLAVVARGETYGYAIAQDLEAAGLGHVKGGALYPVLTSLEKEGLISSAWVAGDGGPGRKMLTVTPDGLSRLLEHREQWGTFTAAVGNVLHPAVEGAAARPGRTTAIDA